MYVYLLDTNCCVLCTVLFNVLPLELYFRGIVNWIACSKKNLVSDLQEPCALPRVQKVTCLHTTFCFHSICHYLIIIFWLNFVQGKYFFVVVLMTKKILPLTLQQEPHWPSELVLNFYLTLGSFKVACNGGLFCKV